MDHIEKVMTLEFRVIGWKVKPGRIFALVPNSVTNCMFIFVRIVLVKPNPTSGRVMFKVCIQSLCVFVWCLFRLEINSSAL